MDMCFHDKVGLQRSVGGDFIVSLLSPSSKYKLVLYSSYFFRSEDLKFFKSELEKLSDVNSVYYYGEFSDPTTVAMFQIELKKPVYEFEILSMIKEETRVLNRLQVRYNSTKWRVSDATNDRY